VAAVAEFEFTVLAESVALPVVLASGLGGVGLGGCDFSFADPVLGGDFLSSAPSGGALERAAEPGGFASVVSVASASAAF
jgi:hypothetical protein